MFKKKKNQMNNTAKLEEIIEDSALSYKKKMDEMHIFLPL